MLTVREKLRRPMIRRSREASFEELLLQARTRQHHVQGELGWRVDERDHARAVDEVHISDPAPESVLFEKSGKRLVGQTGGKVHGHIHIRRQTRRTVENRGLCAEEKPARLPPEGGPVGRAVDNPDHTRRYSC